MEDFKKPFELINKFFKIQPGENFANDVFCTLKELVNFESGYIFYTAPSRLEYAFNAKVTNIDDIKCEYLKESLMLKNTEFGVIIITGKNFTEYDKTIFKTCSAIIGNITKDFEISKIIKMQLEAIQNVYSEMHKSEKIKSKFLSHISHELRTPLNAIIGFSDLLDSEFIGKLNDKQKEYVNDIKISSVHLLEMVNDILDMSKIEAGAITLNIKEFEVFPAVLEIMNILKPLYIKKNITVIENIENLKIKADYRKFQQILFNLLSNAIKYTPDNGKIILNIYEKDKYILIIVEDNGIGIKKKYHKKIFEKFEQLGEGMKNSTGLGLAITKELVKIHNGRIKVESESGKGAKFIVNLPKL